MSLSSSNSSLCGVFPILAMPFDVDCRIDVEALQREVEYLVSAGVDGVGIALASEVPMLTEAERDLALRTVVDQARGRVQVVMNTSAAGTDLAVFYSRRAGDLGADALMVLPPTATNVSADEVLAYYRAVAAATGLPIFMQDVPTSPISPALAVRIAQGTDHPWYVKVESPPTPPRVAEAVAGSGERLTVFGGAGGVFFVEELRRGAMGTMPGSAIPEAFVQTWKLCRSGREAEAQETFARYATLLNLLSLGGGIGFYLYKEVLRVRGVLTSSSTYVRRPATEPDQIAYREIRHQLELLGLDRQVAT